MTVQETGPNALRDSAGRLRRACVFAHDPPDASGDFLPVDVVRAGGEQRLLPRRAGELLTGIVLHIDTRMHRQPDAQRMRRELPRTLDVSTNGSVLTLRRGTATLVADFDAKSVELRR